MKVAEFAPEAQQGAATYLPAPAAAGPRGAAGPRRNTGAAAGTARTRVGSGPLGGRVARAVLPVADVVGLLAAIAIAAKADLLTAAYALAVMIVLAGGGQHRLRICLRVSDQVGRILIAAALPLLILLPWTPAGYALRLALAAAAAVLASRAIAIAALRAAHRRGLLTEQALLVGAGPVGVQLARLLREHPELGLLPRGFIDGDRPVHSSAARDNATMDDAARDMAAQDMAARDMAARDMAARDMAARDMAAQDMAAQDNAILDDAALALGKAALDNPARSGATPDGAARLPVLGSLADLGDVVTQRGVSRVIICFPAGGDEDLVAAARACRPLHADVCVVPRLYELGAAVPRAYLDEVWGIPLIPLRRGLPPAGRLLKRAFDVVAGVVLLAVAAPVLVAAAAMVRLRCGAPVLFRQVRLTGRGRRATIVKLRTLAEHSRPDTRWVVPIQGSTKLGRLLRSTHLDELPQLINVLRGDMSLVGPRPERPYFATRFGQEVPGYEDRQRMPAGMTGWSQVHGLNGDTSIRDRARFDNQYIEYWSFWLDLLILARTLATAVASSFPDSSQGARR
ncbi:MAG TPA: sugar transferase [Streptosporangiaceae bacterium]|nr:sugar transferase [Streptosporangiaceae bacterium]